MISKHHIEWLTKSSVMYDFIKEKSNAQLRGGRLYEIEAYKLLKKSYQVSINPFFIKNTNIFKYYFKHHVHEIKGDICIIDPYVVALGKFNSKKKNISIVHHLDDAILNKNFASKIFYKQLLKHLKSMDVVIVVSNIWKTFLNDHGIQNVRVIYNAFDVNNYNFSKIEIDDFKDKNLLNNGKPILYLGPLTKGKGVESILKVIDKSQYNCIATSKHPNDLGIKTVFFNDEEFPLFLASCDVVLCMSTMIEGWNRIAHEALLAKTPVIGSGSGGMMELLKKSNQTIVKDIRNLPKAIDKTIKNHSELVNFGWNYASQLNLDYFENEWSSLIKDLVK
ncbi:hypothetical protein RM697_12025 [Ichthyenterobacterium sp. W332]|uniref:Glycosyl transferase family 1 domain-containing protein n=1 Tax=Microcosmobacter mediterraneus TaxID=3075607 RepID=A0ABU2YMJ3_9FLAO|nr:glycosyltransferase [Ichthyenterobacterium sp. W332]MDT0559384.1 hypothetical protein [Ichthyenterobacterium sp. W332]